LAQIAALQGEQPAIKQPKTKLFNAQVAVL
jgi:hypothetical protein